MRIVEVDGRKWTVDQEKDHVVFHVNGYRIREERRVGEHIDNTVHRVIRGYLQGRYTADERMRHFIVQVNEAIKIVKQGIQMLEDAFQRAGGPAPVTLKERILDIMIKNPGPKSPKRMRELLQHHSYDVVREAMSEMVIRKQLVRVSRGIYEVRP